MVGHGDDPATCHAMELAYIATLCTRCSFDFCSRSCAPATEITVSIEDKTHEAIGGTADPLARPRLQELTHVFIWIVVPRSMFLRGAKESGMTFGDLF